MERVNRQWLSIAEIFGGINFRQCGKGRHILYVIINTGKKKIRIIKISPMRADGEIGENFLLAKISAYTVHVCVHVQVAVTVLEPTSHLVIKNGATCTSI